MTLFLDQSLSTVNKKIKDEQQEVSQETKWKFSIKFGNMRGTPKCVNFGGKYISFHLKK